MADGYLGGTRKSALECVPHLCCVGMSAAAILAHDKKPKVPICVYAEYFAEGRSVPFGRPPVFAPLESSDIPCIRRYPYLESAV
jgi:hypothetical protein